VKPRDAYSVLEEANCPDRMFELLDEKYQAEAIHRAVRLGRSVPMTDFDRSLFDDFIAAFSSFLDAHEILINERETRESEGGDDEPR